MRRIFIVEDDRFITAIFIMFLRDLGHELVGRTSSGQEAIALCKDLKPDVVLMDIHLDGDLDGIQTAEMLKREIEVPIIYISSDTSSQVIKRAIVSNSYGYLVKPINKKELGISIDLAFYKHKVDIEQKQREQSYREFISNSPLPIVVVRDGKLMYLNTLGLDVFKTHYIEDVLGSPIQNYVHEDSVEQFCSVIEESINDNKRLKPFLAKMKTVHGDLYWAEITGSIVNFNNQKSIQLILQDISEEKFNEIKIKAYEKALFDANKFSVVLNNKFEVIRYNNHAEEYIREYTEETLYFQNMISEGNKWFDELISNPSPSTDKESVNVEFKNGRSLHCSIYIIYSISGVIGEILIKENCD